MLPNVFLDNIKDLKESTEISANEKEDIIKHEKLIFQALIPDRISFYRTLIREAFAKKQN
jgi:hypothetical protein